MDNLIISEQQWMLLQRQITAFVRSGFLPDHITKDCRPEEAIAKALTIAMKGRELGIPPLQALSSITVIKGKPSLSAELMTALVYRKFPDAQLECVTPVEKQDQEAEFLMARPGQKPQHFRFTMNDAKRAGLSGTGWQKYPAAMLKARALTAGIRVVFPDCLTGAAYTPEEMGAEVDEEGEVVEVKELPKKELPVATEILDVDKRETGEDPKRTLAKKILQVATERGVPMTEVERFLNGIAPKKTLPDLEIQELNRLLLKISEWKRDGV